MTEYGMHVWLVPNLAATNLSQSMGAKESVPVEIKAMTVAKFGKLQLWQWTKQKLEIVARLTCGAHGI